MGFRTGVVSIWIVPSRAPRCFGSFRRSSPPSQTSLTSHSDQNRIQLMKEEIIPVSEFKARCLGLIDSLSREGRSLVITKHGKPVARITPIAERQVRLGETWKGMVRICGDIVHFDLSDDWESNA
jgi:prevent-host-death family protein